MRKNHNRRKLKNYFLNKELQMKLIVVNAVYMLLVFLVMAGTVVLPLYFSLLQSPGAESRYAQLFLFIMAEPLPLVLMIVALLFLAHQIVITHQFCGPLVNFTHSFKAVESGNLTRKVVLRKKDLLKKEAEALNGMINGLALMIGELKQGQTALAESLEQVRLESDSPQARQASEQSFAEALRQTQALKETLSRFTLA